MARALALSLVAVAMLLCLWRLWRGPKFLDRVLAFDAFYGNTIAFLLLFARGQVIQGIFEVAVVMATLGFFGTVALCRLATAQLDDKSEGGLPRPGDEV